MGSGLYLFALGPSLNIPSWLRSRGNATREDENQVRSLLFFDSISALSEESWSEHWKNKSPEEIQEQIVASFIDASNRLIWIYICIGLFFLFFIYTIAYWKTWNNIAQGKSSFIFWGIATILSLGVTIILIYNHP